MPIRDLVIQGGVDLGLGPFQTKTLCGGKGSWEERQTRREM